MNIHPDPDYARRLDRRTMWGLRAARADAEQARRVERRWRWPVLLLLLLTIPAFYDELLDTPRTLAQIAYVSAALGIAVALAHTAWRTGRPIEHLSANALDLTLTTALVLAAFLPASTTSNAALAFRLALAFMTLTRMVWSVQHLLVRGGLLYLLLVSGVVLGLCGLGFWWLEPLTPTLGSGLWLAFTTAATVGFGDVVPTTPASKIFSVFVVMLGYGVLSLVTAAIATRWVETEERTIEREILHDLHRQIGLLHHDLDDMKRQLSRIAERDTAPHASRPDRMPD